MLKKILSKNTCAKCRYCCTFNEKEFDLCPFDVVNKPINGLYPCKYLKENGCCLNDEEKPIECRMWPIQVFNDGDDSKPLLSLYVENNCIGMKDLTKEQIIDGIKEHVDFIKNYYMNNLNKVRTDKTYFTFLMEL